MAKDKRPMVIKTGDSIFDSVMAYYVDPVNYPISAKHEEIRLRWALVVNLLLKKYSKIKIASMLIRDYNICQAQAYIDIRNAENLFGNVIKTDKEARKAMWYEWAIDFLQRAIRSGDTKAEGKALDMIAKYGELITEDLSFNPEKLENRELKLIVPKEQLDILKQLVSKGVVDFNNLNVTDVNFEEVSNE